QGTSLAVRIFDDRMEIINPGGLPDGLPQKDFGRVSLRRNELVCDVFQRLGLVERAGTGIQRMREALAAAKLPAPEIHSEDFFAITLRRQNLELLEGMGKKYGEKVRGKSTGKILALIAQNPQITIPELAKALGIGIRPVEKHIARLKAEGHLRRVGPAKGGHWEADDGT
ncbi:MAG TPA: ATP-binding protein, partial [Fibrobacteraceae bacterium]|nr:ATP-binding protein [Fibrobacteraceae bacterium]